MFGWDATVADREEVLSLNKIRGLFCLTDLSGLFDFKRLFCLLANQFLRGADGKNPASVAALDGVWTGSDRQSKPLRTYLCGMPSATLGVAL